MDGQRLDRLRQTANGELTPINIITSSSSPSYRTVQAPQRPMSFNSSPSNVRGSARRGYSHAPMSPTAQSPGSPIHHHHHQHLSMGRGPQLNNLQRQALHQNMLGVSSAGVDRRYESAVLSPTSDAQYLSVSCWSQLYGIYDSCISPSPLIVHKAFLFTEKSSERGK